MSMKGSHIPDFLCEVKGMSTVEYAVAGLVVALVLVTAFAQLTMADILEWCICLF